jgi:RNA polymerase sigma-70 factor, ECF subfamily
LNGTAGSGTGEDDRRDLIARAVAGFQSGIDREKHFKFLHDRFYKAIRNVFHGISPEDALDLTQETFLALYKGLKGFRGDSELSTWLFRIAKNKRFHWFRRPRAREDSDDRTVPDDGLAAWDDHQPVAVDPGRSPEQSVQLEEDVRLLREAIETLPQQMRKCLEHRVYDELSYQEIADHMEISIQTVKAHLFQARKKLKDLLETTFRGLDF